MYDNHVQAAASLPQPAQELLLAAVPEALGGVVAAIVIGTAVWAWRRVSQKSEGE